MLAHAIDNPAPSTTVVLISGDRDFAYALSILRHRHYHIVLITLSNAHPSLRAQASLSFDWISDVLGPVHPTHQSTSPRRAKTLTRPAHDSLHSDSKGHNPSTSLFQEINDEKPASSVEFTNYFPDKAKYRENCLTTPIRSFRPDFLPPDLELSKRQPTAASSASSTLRKEPECPARAIYSPVTSSRHAYLNDSIERPLTVSHHSKSLLSFAETTPTLAPHSTYVSLRGSTSLPNLVLEREIASVTDSIPFGYTEILPLKPGLRGSFPSSQQQINPKPQTLSTINQVDDHYNDPDLPLAHLNTYPPTNVTAPLSTSALSHFMLPSSLSHTDNPFTGRSSVKATNPVQPPPPPPPPIVPDKFKILVQCLKTHRSKGNLRPLRSKISIEIARNGSIYRQAGVLKFREYAAIAEEAGIIELGGSEGTAWIALMEPWY